MLSKLELGENETLCFISHHREGARGEARTLHTELVKCLSIDSKSIFIDNEALQDLDQLLRRHVGMTRVLLFLKTRDALFQPFVLAEMYTAVLDGIGILTVNITNWRDDFNSASEFLGAKDFVQRLEEAFPGSVGALQRQGIDVAQMGLVLNQQIPNLQSVPFDMTWPSEIREAAVKFIGTRIVEMAEKVPPRTLKPAPVGEAERVQNMIRKLEERGIPQDDAIIYAPRLVREGFTAENLVALARPGGLKKAGITRIAHVSAILSSEQLIQAEAKEEAELVIQERLKMEQTKRELDLLKQQIEASKAAATAAIGAATDEERRALIAKAERMRNEAENTAKRSADRDKDKSATWGMTAEEKQRRIALAETGILLEKRAWANSGNVGYLKKLEKTGLFFSGNKEVRRLFFMLQMDSKRIEIYTKGNADGRIGEPNGKPKSIWKFNLGFTCTPVVDLKHPLGMYVLELSDKTSGTLHLGCETEAEREAWAAAFKRASDGFIASKAASDVLERTRNMFLGTILTADVSDKVYKLDFSVLSMEAREQLTKIEGLVEVGLLSCIQSEQLRKEIIENDEVQYNVLPAN